MKVLHFQEGLLIYKITDITTNQFLSITVMMIIIIMLVYIL